MEEPAMFHVTIRERVVNKRARQLLIHKTINGRNLLTTFAMVNVPWRKNRKIGKFRLGIRFQREIPLLLKLPKFP